MQTSKEHSNVNGEKQRSTEDNIYKSDKTGGRNSSKQKEDWKQM